MYDDRDEDNSDDLYDPFAERDTYIVAGSLLAFIGTVSFCVYLFVF